MKTVKFLTLAAFAAIALTACNKDDNNNTSSTSSNPNTFKVRMTDSPGNYSAFNTSITKVEAYLENHGWITLDSNTHSMNVLSLNNGTETTLVSKSSPMAGHYTKIRLTMGTNSTFSTNDQSGDNNYNLSWAGSSDNTVEVTIDKTVSSGSGSSVLLDYNVAQSISAGLTGGYSLTPMITWVEDESTGVRGDVNGAVRGMITFSNALHAYSTFMTNQGLFLIRGMADGTYTMTIDGQSAANSTTHTMQQSNIVVVHGQIKNMGTINFQ